MDARSWLEFIQTIVPPPGRWLDFGSSSLSALAHQVGYQVFRLDTPPLTPLQQMESGTRTVRGNSGRLPFISGSFDVISLPDMLGSSSDPVSLLAECPRLLTPEGLLLGASLDPLFVDPEAATRPFDRPPSFWISLLRSLGLALAFRFPGEAGLFQFLATRSQSEASAGIGAFIYDSFSSQTEFIRCSGPLAAVPRFGWGSLELGSRPLSETTAACYLLNETEQPLSLSIRMTIKNSPDFGRLRIRLDSFVLKEIFISSEKTLHEFKISDILIPSGGHHLFFELSPGAASVAVGDLEIAALPAASSELTSRLPFDLFQRYRLAAQVTSLLNPAKILDVGGLLGDRDGHLAVSADFLEQGSKREVVSTDLRHCDHPRHRPASAWQQPFPDRSFDLVISLDVLEHLPAERRPEFLSELDRLASQWILLGAPFSSPEVEATEEILAREIMAARRFLQEHRQLGLPHTSLIEDFFVKERNYQAIAFPNGFLPRWRQMQALTQHYFSLNDYRVFTTFNRLYNQNCFIKDQHNPAYRILFLVCKTPLTDRQGEQISSLQEEFRAAQAEGAWEQLSGDPDFYRLHERVLGLLQERERALNDVQFLANARQELIHILDKELKETPIWKMALRRIRSKSGEA